MKEIHIPPHSKKSTEYQRQGKNPKKQIKGKGLQEAH